MRDPTRLLDEAVDGDGMGELERELLRSAALDAPRATARHRTALALGIAAGGLAGGMGASATATAATTAGSAGSTVGPAGTAGAAATSAWLKAGAASVLAKWVGVAIVGGAVAAGAVRYAPQRRPPSGSGGAARSTVEGAERSAPVVPLTPAPPIPIEIGPTPRTVAAEPPRAAQATLPSTPVTPLETASPAVPKPTRLAEETAALDAARRLLGAGDATDALESLDAHDREFPEGLLAPEATLLRIEALAQRGDDDAALSAARAFLASHPASPHAHRIRSITDGIQRRRQPP